MLVRKYDNQQISCIWLVMPAQVMVFRKLPNFLG